MRKRKENNLKPLKLPKNPKEEKKILKIKLLLWLIAWLNATTQNTSSNKYEIDALNPH